MVRWIGRRHSAGSGENSTDTRRAAAEAINGSDTTGRECAHVPRDRRGHHSTYLQYPDRDAGIEFSCTREKRIRLRHRCKSEGHG
ncbi:hypothetical protein XAP412_130014 [Xanthomonas phaseoli pv. phaseoli]|uniref:Uncharacterized protein n=1 Tax=Xanthomonas campestris pv. phaseoli TaxID=317013 RepID=A0AB38DV41_XANCH|nr:hypothetical protein XAP6984_170014 [Xanthomonas phaseoli pv. phaseoli]SON79761.1 hypothetical protein XAP412_130014 [Xanthomonas phaseoli pv. phaseoli]SON81338.1 hypothetical protein XAP7430_120014 [Xanthomonas phaseoli pv. phaseoli]